MTMMFLSVTLVVCLKCPVSSDKRFLKPQKSLQWYTTVYLASFQGFGTSEVSAFASKHRFLSGVPLWWWAAV